jgi:hypothetical protein
MKVETSARRTISEKSVELESLCEIAFPSGFEMFYMARFATVSTNRAANPPKHAPKSIGLQGLHVNCFQVGYGGKNLHDPSPGRGGTGKPRT